MAIITGGLHGRSTGNVGGIIYGAARTRTGKAVTARELVIPSNPNTVDQQIRRNIFSQALNATRNLGPECYQEYLNRMIGQLPGFQSMMSLIINNTNDTYTMGIPPETPLGKLLSVAGLTAPAMGPGTGEIDITWTDNTGSLGGATDLAKIIAIKETASTTVPRDAIFIQDGSTRASAGTTLDGFLPGRSYIIGVFFEGVGDFAGQLSNIKWVKGTAG